MTSTLVARPAVVVLLGVCLLLAGCQGFTDPVDRSPETPTLTPAPVPERAGGSVSADGVDAGQLAERHRQSLSRTNYTLTLTERLVIDGEPRRVTTRRRLVAPDARAYLLTRTERTTDFAPSNYAGITGYWYNGSTELLEYARNTGPRYDAVDDPGPGLLDDPTEHRTIAGILRAFETTETTPRRLPDGSYRLRTDDLSASARLPELGYFVAPRNASLEATVHRRGFVQHYRVAYTATIAGSDRQVRVVRELRVTDTGRTTVTPPAWAGMARSASEGE